MGSITLYPSNWLYNAGVIGLLLVQDHVGEHAEENLKDDGSYSLSDSYFAPIGVESKQIPKAIVNLVNAVVADNELREWLTEQNRKKYEQFEKDLGEFGFRFVRAGNKLFASKTPYQNLVQLSEWQSYEYPDLVRRIPELFKQNEQRDSNLCQLCGYNSVLLFNPNSKLQQRLTKLQATHLKNLGPSLGEFPNGFWCLNQSMGICFLCSFLIIHHHLAFIRLSDGSEIFINAPSFKVMYYLNRFAREVFGASSREEALEKREILAMSVIEYATKIKTTLGIWTGMNIEVVSRYGSQIEYFSLPYEVTELISDRRIAALLSQIGEFAILNLVLAQDFSRLMELGYRLLRVGLKSYGERGKSEKDFIRQTLRSDKNRQNPTRVAERIFQLCAFVEEKRKRRLYYDYAGIY
ncbi:MAG: hypothetical protein D6687_07675 [Acidobacteria bacterium]|jgi:CRISPR-associated protein Cst1|nr:MAG: hypothetical protein D6687_07675 [Acidobacteriota bacterium]GIU81616.1 MAG: hypothetical protein KatS3mg006_0680 [Pyrinomonadaceae bacterium]